MMSYCDIMICFCLNDRYKFKRQIQVNIAVYSVNKKECIYMKRKMIFFLCQFNTLIPLMTE